MDITKLAKKFPHTPGCYLMKSTDGTVLYIGKAKDLQKRVASYALAEDVKTHALVACVFTIDYVLTDTEVEALILESQLIQQYHPKYNIDLQAPGRYAFIQRTDEEYPRFVIARKVGKTGRYFGPFPSGASRIAALKSIHDIFRLCKAKPKRTRKPNPCFRYALGTCSGACVRALSSQEYAESVRSAEKVLRGSGSALARVLRAQMECASATQQFELALLLRNQLRALEKFQEQKVSYPKQYDSDVLSYRVTGETMRVQLFHFQRGVISQKKDFVFSVGSVPKRPNELFTDFLMQYYNAHAVPREIIIPTHLFQEKLIASSLSACAGRKVTLTVPKKGRKKKLLDLLNKNIDAKNSQGIGLLEALQKALHLEKLPQVIDCIDISTLSGTETVASRVRFANGQPAKDSYRRYRIKGVFGVNDYAAIAEVVARSAKRFALGDENAPDLLVIDGGRGQLNSARTALEKEGVFIPTIGLAKRLEQIYVSWARMPLQLTPNSSALQLLRAVRDEAHRFAVFYQRKRRIKK